MASSEGASNSHLPRESYSDHENAQLDPPQAPFSAGNQTPSVADSGLSSPNTPNNSAPLLPQPDKAEQSAYNDVEGPPMSRRKGRGNGLIWLAALAGIAVIAVAVVVPVYFTVIKPKQNNVKSNAATGSGNSGSSPSGSDSGTGAPASNLATMGADGSTVTTQDGSTFTYKNQFGGFWVDDPNDPFNDNAQPNSWTPPLNTSWTWGKDRVYGVNLGGLFVLEPFIAPALFQKYPQASDEWSLSVAMAADTASGGLNQIEDHYNTFITEQDIAEIAGAGLNWIRLPIPYWAIETWPGEPFLAKTSWKYILRLLGWCRKYGLRVNLDLHTIPGSQNGYNHSGKDGQVNWLLGVMGIANVQRSMNYIRIITEFISQPQWKNVVPVFGIVNEPLMKEIGKDVLSSFYVEAHQLVRGITGTGAGNGPYISIGDGFQQPPTWAGFLQGSDRIILDTHPYFAFDGQSNTQPIATGEGSDAGGQWPAQACRSWGPNLRNSQSAFGVTIAGEWSNGYNDCGLFVRGVGGGAMFGDCTLFQDASQWNSTLKAGLQAFAEAQMDTLGDWFFWTWKIGNSTAGHVEAPLWSYQLGLQGGWMPTDPRTSVGRCSQLGVDLPSFDGNYQPYQTGGAGAGNISPDATQGLSWPPPSISDASAGVLSVSLLPTYTPTGTVNTLPPPTITGATKSIDAGNGWANPSDTSSAFTAIATCSYPDPWNAQDAAIPPPCGGGVPAARRTASPIRR